MNYKVVVLAKAQEDIDQIRRWLAERSPQGAEKWVNGLEQALTTLETDPDRFEHAPESKPTSRDVRQMFFRTRKGRTYRAMFTRVGEVVFILHVRGPGQPPIDPENL